MRTPTQKWLVFNMMISKELVKEWLDRYGVKNYTINDDLTVDVDGYVDLTSKRLKRIPIQFGNVSGGFYCSRNSLTSLKGSPISVGSSFNCMLNKLTSLEYIPKEIVGYFTCYDNQITSLIGGPEKVLGSYSCAKNKITSLKGCPEIVYEEFDCQSNALTSLEYMPQLVGNKFYFMKNNLEDTKLYDMSYAQIKAYYEERELSISIPVNDKTNPNRNIWAL